jgi:hypothetical protein
MTLTFLPFGPRWQMHRKLLQTSFSNSNVGKWQGLQTQEAHRTVQRIMKTPENWAVSLKRRVSPSLARCPANRHRFAVAIVLKVSYGVDVLEDDDPYIQIADDAMHATGNGGVPANSIVDIFPLGKAMSSSVENTLLNHYVKPGTYLTGSYETGRSSLLVNGAGQFKSCMTFHLLLLSKR